MTLHTLLIWEWNPENIQVYLIPNDQLTEAQSVLLERAHGYYINGNGNCLDNTGLAFLNQALLEDTPQNREDNKGEQYVENIGMLVQYAKYDRAKDAAASVLNNVQAYAGTGGVLISRVIVSGFYL
jgi:hypothetical protein